MKTSQTPWGANNHAFRVGFGPWAFCLFLALGAACGSDPGPPALPHIPTILDAQPLEQLSDPGWTSQAPSDLHFVTDLFFTGSPDAPHRLTVTFQGPTLCRWTMQRLLDEDKDRIINYRMGDRIFELPQDTKSSIEYGEADAALILRRMELRRAAMFWPDAPHGQSEWAPEEAGVETLILLSANGEKLGHIQMQPSIQKPAPEGREPSPKSFQLFTAFDDAGKEVESLRILERYNHEGRSWPKSFALLVGPTEIWRETVSQLNTQSWFGEEYFAPMDRARELFPQKE